MAKKREVNYFELMQKEMTFASRICKLFSELIDGYGYGYDANSLQEKLNAIHQIEHDGDVVHDEIIFELDRAFVTPIEREDILEVARYIDEITNAIENVSFRFWMFDIGKLRCDLKSFIDLIEKCCAQTAKILAEFENFKKSKILTNMIHELYNYENEGDNLYRCAVRNLFRTEKNAIEVLKWRELYHDIEYCFDACREVGRAVEYAVVKNS